MTVREMIIGLLNCPMDAKIEIEIQTDEGYVVTEKIDQIMMVDDGRCLITED